MRYFCPAVGGGDAAPYADRPECAPGGWVFTIALFLGIEQILRRRTSGSVGWAARNSSARRYCTILASFSTC